MILSWIIFTGVPRLNVIAPADFSTKNFENVHNGVHVIRAISNSISIKSKSQPYDTIIE